jgi:hypothetical protein
MLNVLNDDINNSMEEYKMSVFIFFPRRAGNTFISNECKLSLYCYVTAFKWQLLSTIKLHCYLKHFYVYCVVIVVLL